MLSWVAACESNLEKLCKKRQIICREIHPKPASLSKKNFCDAKTYYRGIFAGVLLVKMSAPRISWFPGHMASAIKQIEQRIKVVDLVFHSGFVFLLFWIAVPIVEKPLSKSSSSQPSPIQVIEVRDARVPLSSACTYLEPMLRNRRHLIVLNKRVRPPPQKRIRLPCSSNLFSALTTALPANVLL